MAKKILVVVDVQNDFVYGSLGSDEANDLYCIDGLEGIRQNSELKTVFKDGRIVHRDTFEEIRNRLNGEI